MIRVEGHKNLYRDENSGAIINCDDVAYDNYIRTLKTSEKKKNEIDQMKRGIIRKRMPCREFVYM